MPPWDLLADKLLNLVLPAFVAAAVVAWLLLPRGRVGFAMCAGLAAGNYLTELVPWWPEVSGWERLILASVLAVLPFELAGATRVRHPWARVLGALWIGAGAANIPGRFG